MDLEYVETTIDAEVSQITYAQIDTATTAFAPYSPPRAQAISASIEVRGDFGTGGTTLAFEQSNSGEAWFPLIARDGTEVSFTAPGIVDIDTSARFIRPVVPPAGDAFDLTVTAIFRG